MKRINASLTQGWTKRMDLSIKDGHNFLLHLEEKVGKPKLETLEVNKDHSYKLELVGGGFVVGDYDEEGSTRCVVAVRVKN